MKIKYFLLLLVVALLPGCASASEHRRAVSDDTGDRITVGKVQREIKVGMSSAQVIEVLGSPNVVSTDEERREVWVYDKISTLNVLSSSANSLSLGILGGGGGSDGVVGGGLGAGGGAASGASSTSQRTLTIVIKFDKDGKVRDFAYHNTSF